LTETLVPHRVSHSLAALAAEAAFRKHAEDILILDLRQLSSVTDYFVIGTAMTRRQMAAITEHIEEELARSGGSVWHVEGLEDAPPAREEESAWVLMDCGDVVIHLFSPAARALYQLERLWADAPRRAFCSMA
jgi:ribosome-associated protein